MKFRVTVKTPEGSEETNTLEAENRFEVYSLVEKNGGQIVGLEEVSSGLALPKWLNIKFGSGVKTDEKITFTKNLSAMLGAGLTLSRALSVIERQSKNKYLKEIIEKLQANVKGGMGFHESLAEFPNVFSKLFVAMTKAGEESGKMSETLAVVAKQMDTSNTLTKKVKGAMIYPCIILFAILVIGILMLMFVVPTLSATFKSLGVDLPLSTRIIVAASDFMAHNAIIVVIALAAVIAGLFFAIRSKQGSAALLFVGRHLPVVGDLVRETFSARAARTLSSLLSSGVEMLTAIGIASEVVGENVFGKVLAEAEEQVRKGEPLSTAFSAHEDLYPVFVSEMILVGEETGKVADMLGQVAEYFERDVEERTKDLSTIIEPILMLFIGVFVGIFAISMIAPIYSLSGKI
ncbi:MAG TPA: type II secretion system F family protein [Candidatus Paceibacterota bacterium]|nr:type II secretion system F family protein [Candidatus Paceibacterota bacterium]